MAHPVERSIHVLPDEVTPGPGECEYVLNALVSHCFIGSGIVGEIADHALTLHLHRDSDERLIVLNSHTSFCHSIPRKLHTNTTVIIHEIVQYVGNHAIRMRFNEACGKYQPEAGYTSSSRTAIPV